MPKLPGVKITKLRRFNNILSIVVVCLSAYIVVSPLLPNVTYKIDQVTDHKPALVRVNTPGEASRPAEEIPAENTLVIPSINLQKTVFDGKSISLLEKGVWHRPATSSPGNGGNTVFVGHRYGYNGNGVFYHLDKVHLGDSLVLYWQGKKYTYNVSSIKVVPPTDATVEAPTAKSILTIYTCTPMWTFTDRLVIIADEVSAL